MKIHFSAAAGRKAAVLAFALSVTVAASVSGCASGGTKPDSSKEGAPAASPSPSAPDGAIPLAGAFKVHRYTLDNGLRLLVVEDHTSPTFAYNTFFKVGSRDEVPGLTGLAHLFEHMMFKETKNLKDGEFDRILESSGAEGENAFTSNDYTGYVQEMPADKLDLIAKLEADRMVNLLVNEEAFKTEREVVQNERRARMENSPDGTMYQELYETAFTKHSYRWPIIGYEKDLAAMTAADALKFYKAYYAPNHATIVVTGDVTPDQVHKAVKKHYSGLKSAEAPAHSIETEPPQTSARRKTLKLNIQVEKLMMGYHIPGVLHEDMPKLGILGLILTGGKSSRLQRALVDTGIASGVDASEREGKDPSLFLISANLQKGKKAAQAEAVILREIKKVVQRGVTAQEVARARNRLSFAFYEGLNTNPERARFLGFYEAVTGDFKFGLDNFNRAMAVTPEDVQAVAKAYLDPNNRTVITGVNK